MISIEVDGERIAFDDFYEESDFYPCGAIWGIDEKTKNNDAVRGFLPTKCLWSLAAYKQNDDGSFFGFEGLFKRGEWAKDENGEPLYKVWDRII